MPFFHFLIFFSPHAITCIPFMLNACSNYGGIPPGRVESDGGTPGSTVLYKLTRGFHLVLSTSCVAEDLRYTSLLVRFSERLLVQSCLKGSIVPFALWPFQSVYTSFRLSFTVLRKKQMGLHKLFILSCTYD